jgi:hypothetical protein
VYWLTAGEWFKHSAGKLQPNAGWRIAVPVVVGGGLTPLAAAAQTDNNQIPVLLSPSGMAFIFVLIVLWAVRDQKAFLRLLRPAGISGSGRTRLQGRHLLVGVGVLIIWYGAAINIIVPTGS